MENPQDGASWPTPRTTDTQAGRGCVQIGKGLYRPSQALEEGRLVGGANLADAVAAKMWPTPHSSCSTGPGHQGRQGGVNLQTSVKMWPSPTASDSNARGSSQGNRKSPSLPIHVLENEASCTRAEHEPGPRGQAGYSSGGSRPGSSDKPERKARETWPTPVVTDSIGSGNRNLEGSKAHAGESLTDVANGGQRARTSGSTGRLNPRWVETLMGVPVGWTMPSCTSPVTIEPTN